DAQVRRVAPAVVLLDHREERVAMQDHAAADLDAVRRVDDRGRDDEARRPEGGEAMGADAACGAAQEHLAAEVAQPRGGHRTRAMACPPGRARRAISRRKPATSGTCSTTCSAETAS